MARYLTTTLPYVNADPHLGHAIEFLQADALSRVLRAKGEEVFLNIGTDEHGAKIAEKAKEAGKNTQAYVDEYAERFRRFADALHISYDAFTRTTDAHHMRSAQAFWRRCRETGDIYLAAYDVKYCVGCELEKTDSELDHGRCPLHPNREIELRTEENYYFRFSKYQDALLAHYAAHPDFIVPESRMREMHAFVAAGLKDFSISRPKEKLSWGVPVPDDDAHVMYVWFDALVNYVSAIGWPDDTATFEKWWPVTQLAGKDNLRQQCAMWQAMLFSAGIPLSEQVFIHGFILSQGQKMSKSLGNGIDPYALIERYGVDATRYLLLRHVHPFEDTDITLERLDEWYTANLVNGLGNLVARVMTLAEGTLAAPVALHASDESVEEAFSRHLEAFAFHEACDLIFAHVAKGDLFMTEHAPYKKIKDPLTSAEARVDIEKLVRHLAKLAAHLSSIMPATAESIRAAVRENKKPDNLFPRL